MARPKRINLPFTLFHVFSRTNSDDLAFLDVKDREKFMGYLIKYITLFHFTVHAYCLMDTHFHFLLESGEDAEISELIRRLLTAYTVFFNKKYGRHGHLFQGRFKSHIVDKATYLLELTRYIHLNPARSGNLRDFQTYPWSSFHHYLYGSGPSWLNDHEVLSWFNGSREKYAEYVINGLEEQSNPSAMTLAIYKQRFIGGTAFAERVLNRIKLGVPIQNGKSPEANAKKKDEKAYSILKQVAEYFGISPEHIRAGRYGKKTTAAARKAMVYILRERFPWPYCEIAQYLNLKNSFSAYLLYRKANKDKDLMARIEVLLNRMFLK